MISAVRWRRFSGLNAGFFSGRGSSSSSVRDHLVHHTASLVAFAVLGIFSCLAIALSNPAPAQALQSKAVGPITIGRGETVDDDITTAYGRIEVRGQVDGDVTTGSGNVLIYGPVEGDVTSGVGDIEVKAPVGGDIKAGFGDVRINDNVEGDVEVERGDLFLGPNANVEGNIYPGNGSYDESPEATVGGDVRFGPSADTGQVASDSENGTRDDDIEEDLGVLGFVGWVLGAALFTGVTVLVSVLMPRTVGSSARMIGAMPGRSALVGLGSVGAAFVIFAVLLISGVGIPLLILLVPVYLVLVVFGAVVFAYFLGRKLVFLIGGYRHGNALAAVIGAVIVALAGLLPFGGFLIGLLALLGAGAAILALFNRPRATGFGSSIGRGLGRSN